MKKQVRNKKTKKTKTVELSITEMDQWEKDNPDWEIVIGAPLIHTGGGLGLRSTRTDDTFKDKLRQIDKATPGNTLRDYAKF